MNWNDIANLRRAADRLDAEAESWKQGFAVYRNGEWRFNGEYPAQEVRVMGLEASAGRLRELANKAVRSQQPDYQI